MPTDVSTTQNFLVYVNFAHGLKIKYPTGWTRQERPPQAPPDAPLVAFLSQPEGPTDIFRENLNILVEDVPAGSTLATYEQNSIDQLPQTMPHARILGTSDATLASRPARRMVLTGPFGPTTMQWMITYTLAKSKAYVLSYSAQPDKYSKFLDTIEAMLASFEIT